MHDMARFVYNWPLQLLFANNRRSLNVEIINAILIFELSLFRYVINMIDSTVANSFAVNEYTLSVCICLAKHIHAISLCCVNI